MVKSFIQYSDKALLSLSLKQWFHFLWNGWLNIRWYRCLTLILVCKETFVFLFHLMGRILVFIYSDSIFYMSCKSSIVAWWKHFTLKKSELHQISVGFFLCMELSHFWEKSFVFYLLLKYCFFYKMIRSGKYYKKLPLLIIL